MNHIIIGTAGHVDHGKTSLIKALTSIDCDTHRAEKERGITINLGFAYLDLPSGESPGIVDVPGHKDFINTMVSGAFSIDAVLLVIAADSGVMPQTIEHFNIVELLGVEKGIVVITKIDLVDEDMIELVELEARELIRHTVLEEACIVRVSSKTGEGLSDLISTIMEAIPHIKEKTKTGHFRMYIDRVFNPKGIGFIVTGSVIGGKLIQGNHLYLLPGKFKQFKVRSIERHGKHVDEVIAGDRAALHLSGFKKEYYKRGMLLSDKELESTNRLDATLKLTADNHELKIWSNIIFCSGSFECAARIHLLDRDKLKQGETAIIQVHLAKPAILINKDRFIIRNSSNDMTLGGGVVLDANPLNHRRRSAKLLESLSKLVDATLRADSLYETVKIELKKHQSPLYVKHLAKILEASPDKISKECEESGDRSVRAYQGKNDKILVDGELHSDLVCKTLHILSEYHRNYYLMEEGMEGIHMSGKLGIPSSDAWKEYLHSLLNSLLEEGSLKKVRNTWALTDHNISLGLSDKKDLEWLESTVKGYDRAVPDIKEIEARSNSRGINKEKLNLLFGYLLDKGKLYITNGEYFHKDPIDRTRNAMLTAIHEKGKGITEKEFRLASGSTKNFSKAALRLFVAEKIITQSEFHIHMTEKGSKVLLDSR
jgi:selenocysteine-specific elongation factor